MTPLRIVGGLLAVAGLVLVCAPTLVHDPGPAPDLFATIERRIPYGAVLGAGALLIARTKLKPYLLTFAHVVLWIVAGFLVARLIGLALDGAGSPRQWVWVAVEAVIAAPAAIYAWRKREPAP